MNVNAGHERTSKARIIHQIQLIRGITQFVIFVLQFILRHAIFFLSQIRFGCTYVIHKYP
ncbi:hypothetical protein [Shigella dysenteriae]|nr:hypothetical protein [Shigella dysenteriae]WNT50632.1 hypothetical protein PWP84_20640 [Shigella dysenteriae]